MDKKIIQKIGIIGDGLTGNLVALALFRLGYPVELVGKKVSKPKPSVASISISNDSYNFLKKLKLKNLEKISNSINSIKLYENHKDYLDPDSIFYNKTKKIPLSYIVLKDKLYEELSGEIKNLKIKKVFSPNKYALTINTVYNDTKKKDLSWDYNEDAFTFIIKHEKLLNNCSRQFFLNDGPLAFLPINQNNTSLVWSLSKNSEMRKIVNSKLSLEKYLNSNFLIYKNVKLNSKIESFSLKFNFLTCGIEPRKINIGDISHRIHPIAGQGWNMTVRDIKQLYDVYQDKKKYGYDFGDFSLLEEYEKKTKINNFIFASSIDLIRRIFKFNNNQISNLRKSGFRQLDKFPDLKNEIIKFADEGLSL